MLRRAEDCEEPMFLFDCFEKVTEEQKQKLYGSSRNIMVSTFEFMDTRTLGGLFFLTAKGVFLKLIRKTKSSTGQSRLSEVNLGLLERNYQEHPLNRWKNKGFHLQATSFLGSKNKVFDG